MSMSGTRIKICGLTRECDIDCVNRCRPDYIGFVFAQSRRQITGETAAFLKSRLIPDIKAVGVFVNEAPERIIQLVQDEVIDLVQLHGQESEENILHLKNILPCPVIRAVPAGNREELLRDTAADYLLLDNGGGGTGKTFDWSQRERIGKPFFLAGGLNQGNIIEGIRLFHPYAVDLSSGVETDGLKDPRKIEEIIRRVRNEYE